MKTLSFVSSSSMDDRSCPLPEEGVVGGVAMVGTNKSINCKKYLQQKDHMTIM